MSISKDYFLPPTLLGIANTVVAYLENNSEHMGKLIVNRKPDWINKVRNIGIYINGKKVGTIKEGERKVFDLGSGINKVNGKIDWCRSPVIDVNIEENESKEIEIKGFKYANIIMPIGMGSMVLFLMLNLFFKIDLKFLLVGGGLGFLYILYFITLGRNNYLSIQEINRNY